MKLLYAFIYDFRALQQIGLCFHPDFKITTNLLYRESPKNKHSDKYDSAVKAEIDSIEVEIRRRDTSLPADFWGSKVFSLTAIVGQNGTGKSTAVEWLLTMLTTGAAKNDCRGFLLYLPDNYKPGSDEPLTIYYFVNRMVLEDKSKPEGGRDARTQTKPSLRLSASSDAGISLKPLEHRDHTIESLYYSGHFVSYTSLDVTTSELSGETNISDSACLIKDLQDYSNGNTMNLYNSLFNHYEAYYIQNNYRIARLLTDPDFRENLKSYKLPRYIAFSPNRSYELALKNPMYIHLKDEDKQLLKDILKKYGRKYGTRNEAYFSKDPQQGKVWLKNEIFVSSLINFCVEKNALGVLEGLLKHWNELAGGFQNDIMEMLRYMECDHEFTGLPFADRFIELFASRVLMLLDLSSGYDPDHMTLYIDLENISDKTCAAFNNLLDYVHNNRVFLTSRFLDLYFSHELGEASKLSSGEQALLNLVSRLRYHIKEKAARIDNLHRPRIIMLDEAEIGFHPDWQRRYVYFLLDCVNALFKVSDGLQIVYTTHSPISLSEVPLNCINMLKRDEGDRTVVGTIDMPNTFGANIFDIYKKAYILESFVGKYAEQFIAKLADEITGEIDINREEEYRQRINLIGDDRIRNYLQNLLRSRIEEMKADEMRREIDRLREKVRKLEGRHEED